jgi:hypothetical protein
MDMARMDNVLPTVQLRHSTTIADVETPVAKSRRRGMEADKREDHKAEGLGSLDIVSVV